MQRALLLMAAAGHLLCGCADEGKVTGGSDTAGYAQSETSITTSHFQGKDILVVAFNDETGSDATIQYTPTTRKILAGATQMGWSYSSNGGTTWAYGGRVSPPKDWAVLWGDPALTTSGAYYNVVFMSTLGIPSSKMPAGGIDGAVNPGAWSYIGGACIARSMDGGKTFAHYQCVQNTTPTGEFMSEKGHFYDGGSLASTSSGAIYAAFVDVTSEKIDVWRAASHNDKFELLPTTPFPQLGVVSHPRLRVASDGSLYVAAQIFSSGSGVVYINRYAGGAWSQAVQASELSVIYPCVDFDLDACTSGNGLRVRTGPQFSFDIGAESFSEDGKAGQDAIRLLYTRRDPDTKRLYLGASTCPLSLNPGCSPAPGWGIGPGKSTDKPLDAFNPNVAAWRGFIGLPPAWTSTFLYRYGLPSSGIYMARANLAYLSNGDRLYFPIDLVKAAQICPDTRGYWGDYDDLVHSGFSGTSILFVRTMTDSSAGCSKQWTFTAREQHVRALRFSN